MDKNKIGSVYRGSAVFVKPESIRAYAKATNDPNPMYKDGTADTDLIAPPVFPVTLVGGIFRDMLSDDVGMDFSKMVHGEQSIQTYGLLKPWDLIYPIGKIVDIQSKKLEIFQKTPF